LVKLHGAEGRMGNETDDGSDEGDEGIKMRVRVWCDGTTFECENEGWRGSSDY
jgi:hypothetical protein